MEKIIFLDIDGVMLSFDKHDEPESVKLKEHCFVAPEKYSHLNRSPQFAYNYLLNFDKKAVALINRLTKETGAKIVIHSDWIMHFSDELLYDKLIIEGIERDSIHEDYIGRVYRLSQEKIHRIEWWIDDKIKEGSSFQYVIIDDMMRSYEHPTVKPNSAKGFCEEDFVKAKMFLVDCPLKSNK